MFARTASVISEFEAGPTDGTDMEDMMGLIEAWGEELREADIDLATAGDEAYDTIPAHLREEDDVSDTEPNIETGEPLSAAERHAANSHSRSASWSETPPEDWVVREVLQCTRSKGRTYYRVSWKDCDLVTWEDEEDLECKKLIREFHQRRTAEREQQNLKTAPAHRRGESRHASPRVRRAMTKRQKAKLAESTKLLAQLLVSLGSFKPSPGDVLPQSMIGRGSTTADTLLPQFLTEYGRTCFKAMLVREAQHGAEYVCFYHSYSFAAVLYELHTCIARHQHPGLSVDFPPLPRIFTPQGILSLKSVKDRIETSGSRDHDPVLRTLLISASLSIFAPSSEAPPVNNFLNGYSCSDVAWLGLLEAVLELINGRHTASEVIELASAHGIDCAMFGGQPPPSYRGHLLQIFVHRGIVNQLAYASLPYGLVDPSINNLVHATEPHAGPLNGQARILAIPETFTQEKLVRLYHYPADEGYATRRVAFQEKLTELLYPRG